MAKFQFVLDCFRKRGTVIPPHFHDYCELVYYFGGKGAFRLSAKRRDAL